LIDEGLSLSADAVCRLQQRSHVACSWLIVMHVEHCQTVVPDIS